VVIRIEQELVLTRNAFLATLEISNDGNNTFHSFCSIYYIYIGETPLSGINVTIEIKDELETDSIALFAIGEPTLRIITSTNGGTLPAKSTGSAEWLIIPRKEAAPTRDIMYKARIIHNNAIY
jgi:hypothetical protein